jgi:hypothetical protein
MLRTVAPPPLTLLAVGLLLLLGVAVPTFAADTPLPPPVALPRLEGAITVDGVLDEAAWGSAAVVDRFWEVGPGDDVAPVVATVGLLAYDDRYLYVGARCADPEPGKIRAPYVDRDQVSDQDFVQIDLDARDEGRWSMIFRVNPRGVQADGVYDEAVGDDDFAPDFHFESAAHIGESGWSAEMRIPLSTLRYPPGDPQSWRITFFRLYPRQFRYKIASAPIPRSSNCWLCFAGRFTGISGLPHGSGLVATPFVSGGATRGARGAVDDEELALGGDLKWLPRPNLAVDLALDPDFSQVESDATQLGVNTRFALFYPEKRPFFLEGKDLWSSPIRAVHTRTITDPGWGVRATGRPGGNSYTLLVAGDRGGGTLVLPGPESSRFAPQPEDTRVLLGRLRHNFGRSSLGALTTVRQGAGGYYNRVGGADLQWYPGDVDHVAGQLLWSSTRDPGAEAAGGHALSLAWDRTQAHLTWNLLLEDLAREFRADSGFVPQTGIRHQQAYAEYNVYPSGFFRRVRPRFYFDRYQQTGGRLVNRTEAVGVGVDGGVQGILDWYGRDTARAADGRLFDQRYWKLQARFLPSRRFSYLNVTARHGDELDIAGSRLGTGSSLGVLATLSPGDRLQAELSGERRRLDVPAGGRSQRLFTASVARAKLLYTFTPRSFTRVVGEWQGLTEPSSRETNLTGSLLYGYRLDWQSILYVGYEDSPAGDGDRRRELFFKVAYAFRR